MAMGRRKDERLQSVHPLLRPPKPTRVEVAPSRAGTLHRPRPFAGECDEADVHISTTFGGHGKASRISGYTGFLPGTNGAFALNFQQVLKTAEHFREGLEQGKPPVSRPIPERLVDRWGNLKRRDMAAVTNTANIYLRTLDPSTDVDVERGIGKPTSTATISDVPPGYYSRDQEARVQVPYHGRQRPQAPGRIVGYTGHRPGVQGVRQLTFNRVEMLRDKKYGAAPNYEEMSLLVDKVPSVPASKLQSGGKALSGVLRPQSARSYFLVSPIGRRTWAKDFVPPDSS